ncbi:hypothetical protein HPB50_022756 [Hyalomma asiaticum]|uniref:Uncharacterized protein n=1 Tax=Hyalomma asiaticum TaxID=266040 RepID=A0ACB7SNL7_HYAAI|nr:hypothetical protein HPB50_022756 [Hyalomma asiaticum]
MSSSDPPASSKKNGSSTASVPGTTALASPDVSVPAGAKEGLEVFTAEAAQGGYREEGGHQVAKEGTQQTISPGKPLLETWTTPPQQKASENAAAPGAGQELLPRSASQHSTATSSAGSTSQVPANANVSEAGSYVTAECAPKSVNPSVSERSSVFQTAQELGAVRGPWYVMLQNESSKPTQKKIDPHRETTVKAVETELFSWKSREATKVSLAEQTNQDAEKTSKRSPPEKAQPAADNTRLFVMKTPTSGKPPPSSQSLLMNSTGGKENELNSKGQAASTPPKGKEGYHTEPHYKDWPKHESQMIPDQLSTAFLNAKMLELVEHTAVPPAKSESSLIVPKTAHKNEKPAFWEPLYETEDATPSKATPAGHNFSSVAGCHVDEADTSDHAASSVITEGAVHRKSMDIKRSSSADAVNVALEIYSPLYNSKSVLNFDEDQIEEPLQKTPAASHPLSPSDNQTSAGAVQSASTGSSVQPLKDNSGQSLTSKVTQTLPTVLSDATVEATPRRFWILLTFCTLSMLNAFQWIQYSIIASVIKDHYGVSDTVISWTSLLYLIGFMVLAFPSAWILDNMGLRVTVLIGALGTAIGACIKTFAVKPGQFTLVLIGQAFPAFAQAFILGVPPRLSSAWFKYEELSTACSMGVLGNNLGIALGFVIPPNVVHVEDVETSLLYLCGWRRDRPSQPAFGTLFTDGNFWLLLLSYGLNTGAFYSISTLLNPVILVYFPGEETFAGWLGLALVVSGLLGSWLCGLALDRTGKYKEVTLLTYVLATAGIFVYTFILSLRSHWLALLGCLFLGFFMTGYIPIGLQLAAEITYPTPEGISSNTMNMSAQAIGFVMILVSSMIQDAYGDVVANICLCASLVVGCIMTVQTKATLRRQEAYRLEARRRSSIARPSLAEKPADVLTSSPEDQLMLQSASSPTLSKPHSNDDLEPSPANVTRVNGSPIG